MRAQQLTHIGHRHVRDSAAHVAAGQRDLEVQFPQPIPQTDLPQRQATRQRAQRRVIHRHQRCGQLGGRNIDRPPRSAAVAPGFSSSAAKSAAHGIGRLQHRVHQRAERRTRRQRRHRRRHVRPGCILGQRDIAGLVVELGDLRLAGDPGGLGDPDRDRSRRCAASRCRYCGGSGGCPGPTAPAWPAPVAPRRPPTPR